MSIAHRFLGRDTLLTRPEIEFIENTVLETFRDVLIGRDIFPIRQLNDGGGKKVYTYYDETDPSEAVITMNGNAQADDYPDKHENNITVPVLHKNFTINWRDLEASRTWGPSLIEDSVRTAARKVAETEDRLLISGECTTWLAYGLEGLFTATGRGAAAASGNWPANAIADVNVARAALQAAGFVNLDPVMIGPPALIKCLDGQLANTGLTYRQFLLQNGLISRVMESSRAFAADCGVDSVVLVVPGQGNFWAVQGLPPTTILWEDKNRNVYGQVRETIAPVIGRPESIFEISTIVCGA